VALVVTMASSLLSVVVATWLSCLLVVAVVAWLSYLLVVVVAWPSYLLLLVPQEAPVPSLEGVAGLGRPDSLIQMAASHKLRRVGNTVFERESSYPSICLKS
jgi:hypothetical protein